MPIPSVTFTKNDSGATAVPPSTQGVLAIIAAGTGTVKNQPASFTRPTDVMASATNGGMGPACRMATYYITNAKKPVLLIVPTTSTAGAYGTLTHTGVLGTAVPTATGTPVDEFDVIVKFLNGVTLGTTGGQYQYSLDNGASFSGVQNLGTALTITLNYPAPAAAGSTGVSFTLGTSSQTYLAGDVFTVSTTRPQMTNSDLVTALAALQASSAPWDNVLIDVDATAQMIATVDQWIIGLATRFKMAWMNVRHKTKPVPTGETEAAYLTALTAIVSATATDNVDVGADGGFCPDTLTGLNFFEPTSLAIATRSNPAPTGQDPAFTQLGPVPGFTLFDANGNAVWHNEDTSVGTPGLDALRLSTLRTWPGKVGAFITNARMLSNTSSPYQYDQHAKTMNAFCNAAFPLLVDQCSKGLRKQAPDPITGKIYALEADLEAIEEYVNPLAAAEVEGQVNGAAVVLNRTDDVSNQAGAFLNASAQVQSLAYVKGINVVASLVRTLSIPTTPATGT